jgi:DnaJ-domain-containing protein 1
MDYFALFNEPRRPGCDAESLKTRFLALSSAVHPDRLHNATAAEKSAATEQYATLNAAYNCLREPKDRLAHLIECETGAPLRDIQRIPPGTMDMFMEIGQTCRDADAFIAERAKVVSPLIKVRYFEKAMDWTDRLNRLQQQIQSRNETLLAELRQMDNAWDTAPPPGSPERQAALPLERLEELCRILSYINRWSAQIRERIGQLAQ